jgi:hypothetical protein
MTAKLRGPSALLRCSRPLSRAAWRLRRPAGAAAKARRRVRLSRAAVVGADLARQFGGGPVGDAEAGAQRVAGDRPPVLLLVPGGAARAPAGTRPPRRPAAGTAVPARTGRRHRRPGGRRAGDGRGRPSIVETVSRSRSSGTVLRARPGPGRASQLPPPEAYQAHARDQPARLELQRSTIAMTSASPRTGTTEAPRPEHAAAQDGTLRVRVPGAHVPPFPVPLWRAGASGWAEPKPETMRRVAAALKRL